jgi:phosphatidylserine/phosphatidylglycerophosphate/cardiolipin synthase-like enzyme
MSNCRSMLAIAASLCGAAVVVSAQAADVHVGFSPDGGAEQLVVHTIEGAKHTLEVAAYSFTSKSISKALVDAHKRGVKVEIVMDKSQKTERYSAASFLAHAGIPVRIDSQHAIMHNKYMIVDGVNVQTGSYNYTTAAAKHNAENALFLADVPYIAKRYHEDWQKHWEHSTPYNNP